jgi:endonuclease/exonuclease/phosphatase family metal-dependent hydrolase
VIGEMTFAVIGLLFLFADIRTFASTFQLTFFGAPNTNLAIMAISVFATSVLALLVSWRLGRRRALGISGAIFAVATFLCTTSRNNVIDLVLSIIALAAGFWWLAFVHSARPAETPSPLARALPLAFVLDLAARSAARTVPFVDLDWASAVAVVALLAIVFVASGLASLTPDRQWTAPDARGMLGLLAVPCLILLAETGATNGAQVALAGGYGLGPEPARSTQLGALVLGVGLGAGLVISWGWRPNGLVTAAGIAAGGALLWLDLPLAPLVGGAILAAALIWASAVLLGAPLRPRSSTARVVLPLSIGWIAFVAAAFGFYAFYAYEPALYAAIALVALASLVSRAVPARPGLVLAVIMAAVAVGVPALALINTPPAREPDIARNTLRFMTYNVHQGFNAAQIPALETIAQTIERESPDVLCLQEVVRGWMIDEQHDVLSYLSERLGMQYVWHPTIGDLYGNAVLSKLPMTDVKRVPYAREPSVRHQPRGVLFVRTANVIVACTHLDHIGEATFVRQEQVRTIIREIAEMQGPLIVAGDLNAEPGAIEIRLLNEFGLDDIGSSAGETTTGNEPQVRIDYIWGRGVIGSQAHSLPLEEARRASDHRPIIVNVTVQGQ